MGDSLGTVEGIQYIEGIASVHAGDNISTVGDNISTVEGIQYNGGYLQYSGGKLQYCGWITSVLWRLLSTVEIRKSFPELISLYNQIDYITGLKC